MITPKEIREKSERKYYNGFLQLLVTEAPFERIVIRSNKTATKWSLPVFEKEIQQIVSQSKEKKGFGYTIDFQERKDKYLGRQDFPTAIYFDSEEDFLKFLGKEKEVVAFKENVTKITDEFLELQQWMLKNPKKIIKFETKWNDILKVCRYFKENPQPNRYIRELPIKVHTKFVEEHKAIIQELLDILIERYINKASKDFEKRFHLKCNEPQIRFKILDKSIAHTHFSGVDDLALLLNQFEILCLPVKKVLIVENKTTLYTTLTLPEMNGTIAIFGSGYGVLNLKNVEWFHNSDLLYWGDIDVQGFDILSQFRAYFPHTKSVFMDNETFDTFFENDFGTPADVPVQLNLTPQEQLLYTTLRKNNWRLEQEKIPFDYVNAYFAKIK